MGKVYDLDKGRELRNEKLRQKYMYDFFDDLSTYMYDRIKLMVDFIEFETDIHREDADIYILSLELLKIKCFLTLAHSDGWELSDAGSLDFYRMIDDHVENFVVETMKDFDGFFKTEWKDYEE